MPSNIFGERPGPRYTHPEAFDGGLVRQSRPPITTSEWGGREMQQNFLLWNKDYPKLEPARGSLHELYPFLAAANEGRFTENGHAEGIGTLEVPYRGALFADGQEITNPFVTDSLSIASLTVLPGVLAAFLPSSPGAIRLGVSAQVSYRAINITSRYIAKTRPDQPLFLLDIAKAAPADPAAAPFAPSPWDVYFWNRLKPAPVIPPAPDSTAQLPTGYTAPPIQSVTVNQPLNVDFGGDLTQQVTGLIGTLLDIDIVLSGFTRAPWGNYWDVTETGTIKYRARAIPESAGGLPALVFSSTG